MGVCARLVVVFLSRYIVLTDWMLQSQLNKQTQSQQVKREGNIYAIVETVELLERLYVEGLLKKNEYEEKLAELTDQFKTASASLGHEHMFTKHRLFTAMHSRKEGTGANTRVVLILETGQYFITLVDALKMGLCHADELLPVVRDLAKTLQDIVLASNTDKTLPDILSVVQKWQSHLMKMKASEALTESEARQFALDLDNAFSSFHQAVKTLV